jgi:hypothetical protein
MIEYNHYTEELSNEITPKGKEKLDKRPTIKGR